MENEYSLDLRDCKRLSAQMTTFHVVQLTALFFAQRLIAIVFQHRLNSIPVFVHMANRLAQHTIWDFVVVEMNGIIYEWHFK